MMTWNNLSSTAWKDLRAATRIRAKKPLEQSQEKVQNLERKGTNTSGPTNTTGMMNVTRCAASPAPEKRKVREDHEVRDGLSDPTETKGKGKGKGPKGGCHECGRDHCVRDCPVRASKGKSKTSWDWVPHKHWTSYNPGFRKTQWKGKGKGNGGKGLAFGSPKAMQFVHPPLGNVSNGISWQEGECDWHQGGWQDCCANSGLWIGQLTQLTSAKEKRRDISNCDQEKGCEVQKHEGVRSGIAQSENILPTCDVTNNEGWFGSRIIPSINFGNTIK